MHKIFEIDYRLYGIEEGNTFLYADSKKEATKKAKIYLEKYGNGNKYKIKSCEEIDINKYNEFSRNNIIKCCESI